MNHLRVEQCVIYFDLIYTRISIKSDQPGTLHNNFRKYSFLYMFSACCHFLQTKSSLLSIAVHAAYDASHRIYRKIRKTGPSAWINFCP